MTHGEIEAGSGEEDMEDWLARNTPISFGMWWVGERFCKSPTGRVVVIVSSTIFFL
jgi:hypothetical protein